MRLGKMRGRSARNTLQRAPITFRVPRSHGTCAKSCERRNFTGIGLEDSSLALGALCALPGRNGETAAHTLRQLAEAYRLSGVAQTLRSRSRVA